MESREPITINTTDLRLKTRDLMERVKFNGEGFIVKTFGRPMAVIISIDEYKRLNSQSNILKPGIRRVGGSLLAKKQKKKKHRVPYSRFPPK